jgi:hypothetical protein
MEWRGEGRRGLGVVLGLVYGVIERWRAHFSNLLVPFLLCDLDFYGFFHLAGGDDNACYLS